MKIEIHYCAQWDYKPEAVSLAAELEQSFSTGAQLFAEAKGIFDVRVDGNLIFSKYQVGRFPDTGEIVKIIQENR